MPHHGPRRQAETTQAQRRAMQCNAHRRTASLRQYRSPRPGRWRAGCRSHETRIAEPFSHACSSNAFMLTSTVHLERRRISTGTQRAFSASSDSSVFSTATGPALFAHERYVSAETGTESVSGCSNLVALRPINRYRDGTYSRKGCSRRQNVALRSVST